MRTNITLNSELIEQLRKTTQAKTQAKAVVIAIEDYLRRQKVSEIKKFKGKLRFRKDTATSRHHDR